MNTHTKTMIGALLVRLPQVKMILDRPPLAPCAVGIDEAVAMFA